MSNALYFSLQSINAAVEQEHKRDAKQLKEILEPFGFKVALSSTGILSIGYSDADVDRKRTRNAGRKKNYSLGLKNLTYGQVKQMKAEKGASQAAQELGISRRTFYGRLKEYEEKGCADDALFY